MNKVYECEFSTLITILESNFALKRKQVYKVSSSILIHVYLLLVSILIGKVCFG